MQINELQDKTKIDQIDLRIIWDMSEPMKFVDKFTGKKRKVKSVIVADVELAEGPTAYFDIYDKDIKKFRHKDNIRVINAYAKLIPGKNQFRITNAKKIEKI